MITENLQFLFGNRTKTLIGNQEFCLIFMMGNGEIGKTACVNMMINSLANCIREKEKEEYYLASLNDITDETEIEDEVYLATKRISTCSRTIKEIKAMIYRSLPQMKPAYLQQVSYNTELAQIKEKYYATIDAAITFRQEQAMLSLQLDRCDDLISENYGCDNEEAGDRIRALKEMLEMEYNKKIENAYKQIGLRLMKFITYLAKYERLNSETAKKVIVLSENTTIVCENVFLPETGLKRKRLRQHHTVSSPCRVVKKEGVKAVVFEKLDCEDSHQFLSRSKPINAGFGRRQHYKKQKV